MVVMMMVMKMMIVWVPQVTIMSISLKKLLASNSFAWIFFIARDFHSQ